MSGEKAAQCRSEPDPLLEIYNAFLMTRMISTITLRLSGSSISLTSDLYRYGSTYRTVEQCQRDGVSISGTTSHWAKALFGSGLTKFMKINISTEYVGASSCSLYYPSMDSTMERVIKYLFQKDQEGIARHLMLTGFNYDDRKKLPGNWRVTMTQFDPDWIDEPGRCWPDANSTTRIS